MDRLTRRTPQGVECGDTAAALEQLARCGYDGQLNIDHSFFNPDGKGMSKTSEAYFLGYLKGMLGSLERQLKLEKENGGKKS